MTSTEQKFTNPLYENFKYGYDNDLYNLRNDRNSKFNCYYEKARYIPTSFKDECVKVAVQISEFAASQNKKPVILLSGGLDSEIVVRSFLETGRPFDTVTNRFLNDLNSHEIVKVESFCSKFNLNPTYIDIDIEQWLIGDQALAMAEDSKCSRAEMLPTTKLLHDVYFNMNGIPVLGNGDYYLSKDVNPHWRMKTSNDKHQWNYVEFEYILAWMRYAVKKNIMGSISFFQQTPEIILSMALDDEFKNLIETNPNGRHTSRSRKYRVYKRYWPDLIMREKFHGGEQILNLCDYVQKQYLNRRYREYTSKFRIPVKDFLNLINP